MGNQLSIHRSCCPVVVDPKEKYFEQEQKKLIEKQTTSPYRYHRRKSSSIVNHSPIPLFCSDPKKYTFYFGILSTTLNPTQQTHSIFESPVPAPPDHDANANNINPNSNKLTSLKHGKLVFEFRKNNLNISPSSIYNRRSSLISSVNIQFNSSNIIPYSVDNFVTKYDSDTDSIQLESQTSYLTSINWFYYGYGTKDSDATLIAIDNKLGIIYEIDSQFNVSNPVAKITKINDIPNIIKFNNNNNNIDLKEEGYGTKWSTTKNGELLIGSTGMMKETSIIKMNRSNQLYVEDWTIQYNKIRYGFGAIYPGFIWIECMLWSHISDKWIIIPRYVSINAPFDDKLYKNYGVNAMLQCDSNFENISIIPILFKKKTKNNNLIKNNYDIDYNNAKKYGIQTINDLNKKQKNEIHKNQQKISSSLFYADQGVKGFVSARFISGTNEQLIMGIRSHENDINKTIESSICIFNMNGDVIVEDYPLDADYKYKGLIIL